MAVVTDVFTARLRELIEADAPGIIARIDALADAVNVNRRTVYGWMNGETEPRASAVVGVAKFYGVTTDEMLKVGA
jgi:transcriptional regulator with XRE-family HTH domain